MGINERKEKEKAELRQQILDAAIKLFAKHGLEGLSIRKIAEIIEYSPTTVYLYFKDKNEILYELHERGFMIMGSYNIGLLEIKNPLIRLHKMGENYIRFGLENPDYYDLMFMSEAPMEVIDRIKNCEWKLGDEALGLLRVMLEECMEKGMIPKGDPTAVSMAIWSLVHGLVSLAIRSRFSKLVTEEQVLPMMHSSLNWIVNTIETRN